MKKAFTIAALSVAGFSAANAQLILSGTTASENFNGMSGLNLPTGWKMENTNAGADTNYATLETAAALTASSLTTTSSGGAYKFVSSGDAGVGFLNSGSVANGKTIEFGFTNETGSEITELSLDWNYEKYRNGARAWTWNFYTSTDGVNWTAVPAGNQAYASDGSNGSGIFPPQQIAAGVDLTGLSIADGSSYYVRWSLVGSGGTSNGQALAIDDFSMVATTVPEPVTSAMLLGGVGMMAWVVRRKRVA